MKVLSILMVLLIVSLSALAMAGSYEAIIYVNKRNPIVSEGLREHWKPEIPDVGVDEVIRDFRVLARQGSKFVIHALIDTSNGEDGQIGRIKNHIRNINGCEAPMLQGVFCSTSVGQQILTWWGKDADTMYTKLWQGRSIHTIFETIAKAVLRYPVETTCDGQSCTQIVSVADAEDVYGEVIDSQKIMVPHRFLGR